MNDGIQNEEELVTIASFPEPAEANMARTVLEGVGIEVNLRSENANTLIPIAFESELQVHPADEAAAREVLADAVSHPATEETVAAAELQDEVEGRTPLERESF